MGRRIFVLTGPVHSGKTSFLQSAVTSWELAGFNVGGFLNKARLDAGRITGYDLFDLRGGTAVPFLMVDGASAWQRIGGFFLVPGGLERAERILLRDVRADILVVDEVGPLELAGAGIWPALSAALLRGARCLCVVRTTILEEFRVKMGRKKIDIFRHGDPDVLESLTRRILKGTGTKPVTGCQRRRT